MKKRILSILLVLSMLVASLPMFTVAATASGTIDWTANEIVIKTSDEFVQFSNQIRAGNHFVGQTVKLGADIDLTGKSLSVQDNQSGFCGNFDGQYHTIKNVTFTNGAGYCGAIFGCADYRWFDANNPKAESVPEISIKNFAIVDSTFKGGVRFSVLYAGLFLDTTFENIYINATVTTTNSGDTGRTGAFAGYVWESNATFKNCVFDGSVNDNTNGTTGAFIGSSRDNTVVTDAVIKFENCLNVSNRAFVGNYVSANSPRETMINSYTWSQDSIGTGTNANVPQGFTAREVGYPVPTTILPLFETSRYVVFKHNGAEITSVEIENDSLTITEFPKVMVNGVEVKNVIWTDEATGAVVELPYTVTAPTVLNAKVPSANESSALKVQCGAVNGNKQSLRFIGGIWGLEGDAVGFEITVKYKGEDNQLVERTYKKRVDKVFTSINATENGNIKNLTAKSIGAEYIFAAVLEGVPTNVGQVDVTVNTFKVVPGGLLEVKGSSISVSIVDGEIDYFATPLS